MRELSINATEFGFLAASYKVSSGLISLFYSTIGDLFNRKSMLICAIILFILSTLFCALAPTYYTLLTARILAGFFGGIITPSVYAIATDLIPFKRRGKALGTLLASFSVSSTVGIPLGLLIGEIYSWRSTFHFIGACMTLVLIANILFLPSVPAPKNRQHKFSKQIYNLISSFKNTDYWFGFSVMICFTFSGFMLFPFLSPYAVNNIGLQESDLKYIYLVGGIFTVVVSRLAGKLTDIYGPLKVFFPSAVLSLPFIYLYTSIENIPLIPLLFISTGFMVMINARFVPLMTMITKLPREDNRGSFMGVLMALRSFTAASATAFTGLLISESKDGRLIDFDLAGYISIFLSVFSFLLVMKLYRKVFTGVGENAKT